MTARYETGTMSSSRILDRYSVPGEPDVVEHSFTKSVYYDEETGSQMNKRFLHSLESLNDKSVCVVGAGTLGNEIVKDLAMSGVGSLTVVDMDVFEPYNLPRSSLVRSDDLGRPKAEAVARRAAEISPFPITVRGVVTDVTRLGYGFLEGFDAVVSPGDSWSMRSYVSRGAKLMGVPHISCGTSTLNHMGGMMTGIVTMEPLGCTPCYECLVHGNLKDQEAKLSCANYAKEVQAQVMPFSSAVAGFAAQSVIHTLTGGFPYTRDGRADRAWSYMVNEMGFGETDVVVPMTMSRPDCHCSFHRHLDLLRDKEIVTVHASRGDSVRDLWGRISEAVGEDTAFLFDFVSDRVYYLAFPEGDVRDPGRKPPLTGMLLDDREDWDLDRLTIERMPVDHVYMVQDAMDPDHRSWLVRIVFG